MVGQIIQENSVIPLHLEELNEFFLNSPIQESCSICETILRDDNYTSIALGGLICHNCISEHFWFAMDIHEFAYIVCYHPDIDDFLYKFNFVICINETDAMYVAMHATAHTVIILKNDPLSMFGDVWRNMHIERKKIYLVDTAKFSHCNFNLSTFYISNPSEVSLESLNFYSCVMPHTIQYENTSIQISLPLRPNEWSQYNGK